MYNFGRHAGTLPGREGGVLGQGVKADGVTPNDVKRRRHEVLHGYGRNH